MARNALIRALRTTQANLDAEAASDGLFEGELYYVTDAQDLAIGTAEDAYVLIGAGATLIPTDNTLVGVGTAVSPLGVNLEHDFTWEGKHVFEDFTHVESTLLVGAEGHEPDGIKIDDSIVRARLKASSFGQQPATLILHQHATNSAAEIIMSRSASSGATHSPVTTNMRLGMLRSVGWAHGDVGYLEAAEIDFRTALSGDINAGSMPGRIVFRTTRDGSTRPSRAFELDQQQNGRFTENVHVADRLAVGDIAGDLWSSNALQLRGDVSTTTLQLQTAGGNGLDDAMSFVLYNNGDLDVQSGEGLPFVIEGGWQTSGWGLKIFANGTLSFMGNEVLDESDIDATSGEGLLTRDDMDVRYLPKEASTMDRAADQTISDNNYASGDVIFMTSASQQTFTLGEAPAGFQLIVVLYGEGSVVFQGDSGQDVRSRSGDTPELETRYGAVTLIKRATAQWLVIGDI
jgi:hypothetical protein